MKKLRILFLALVPALVLMVTACADDGGDTSSVDPIGYKIVNGVWEISNANGMIAFRNEIIINDNTSAKLVNNINLNGNERNTWLPIAPNSVRYNGIFDGDNHTISGLYIDTTNTHQGLFGTIGANGIVKNLNVKNVIIIADEFIGAIAGRNYGLITNVYVDNARFIAHDDIGAIAGRNNGTINTVYVDNAQFTSNIDVGGITEINYGVITNAHVNNLTIDVRDDAGSISSYNEGSIYMSSARNVHIISSDVTDSYYPLIGGIVADNSGDIVASYVDNATLVISENDGSVGGIVGENWERIISSYTSSVKFERTGNGVYIGGITGDNNNPMIENFFITDNTTISGIGKTNDNTSASPIRTIAELNINIDDMNKAIEIFLIQNNIIDGYRYKVVNDNTLPTYEAYEVPTEFLISDANGLIEFRDLVNAGLNNINAKLTADIDLNSVVWTSIGSDSNRYSGTFDGDNHTISNLTINATAEHQGLFGYNGGNSLIKNLKMNNVTITTTSNFAGAVVGTIVNSSSDTPSMINVHATNVTINGNVIFGGLVGYNSVGLITSSSATNVTITANGQASNDGSGGVVGVNDSNVVATYANGVTITANAINSPNIGGVVGRNSNNVGTLTASYANNLSFNFSAGNAKVGGVTGWINEPTLLNSNFFVSGIGIGSLYGVGSVGAVLSSGPVANATRVGTIQELNNSANTMNNAIDAFVAGNASREFGYRYQAGTTPTTDIPTLRQ